MADLKSDFYKSRRPEFPATDGKGPVSRKQIDDLKKGLEKTAPTPRPHVGRNNEPVRGVVNQAAPAQVRQPDRATATAEIKRMEDKLAATKGVAKDRFQRAAAPAPTRSR